MLIWITAIVLLALLGWIGYQQGAIRAAISFVGFVIAALLAVPLASVLQPVFGFVGLKHPLMQQIAGPGIVFVIISIIFQVIAHALNQKIDHFYKYKMDHTSQLTMERLNSRVGICVGLLNGTVLFILLMIPIYLFGYLTVQIASGEEDPTTLRLVNRARQELHDTNFDKVVAGYDPAREPLYDAFDIVGLVYKNSILESRLSRYPTFLTLAEREEFRQLADDVEFHNLWQGGATVAQLVEHPRVQAITTNSALMDEIQGILIPDLKDLKNFLETGESEKYGHERILGRWQFDFAASVNHERRNRSHMSATEIRQLRNKVIPFWGVNFVATIDNKVYLRRTTPAPNQPDAPALMAEGTWKREAGMYRLAVDNRDIEAVIEDGNRLIVPWGDATLVFLREL